MPDSKQVAGERLAKRMAGAGLCSRREAEVWIAEGRVKVNGRKITTPACVVTPEDAVVVDGKLLQKAEYTRLWLFHKPAGLLTTHKDPEGRPTVFSVLPPHLPRVISVGRLDINSEGLLLLTNDGALARTLELPSSNLPRRYRVRVYGDVSEKVVANLAKGVTVEGVRYQPVKVTFDRKERTNSWVMVTLHEGKNREIRRLFEHFDCKVSRLIRVGYGPFALGDLAKGALKEVSGKEIKNLTTSLTT